MKTKSLLWFVLSLAAILILQGCAGGDQDLDPVTPASIPPLKRIQYLTGADAKQEIDQLHMTEPAPENSWAASYGEGDRIWIYASQFATPEAASQETGRMQVKLSEPGSPYDALKPATVAQQPGLQTRVEGKQFFVFTKGRWMIGVHAIAPDLEPAVASIEWVAAR